MIQTKRLHEGTAFRSVPGKVRHTKHSKNGEVVALIQPKAKGREYSYSAGVVVRESQVDAKGERNQTSEHFLLQPSSLKPIPSTSHNQLKATDEEAPKIRFTVSQPFRAQQTRGWKTNLTEAGNWDSAMHTKQSQSMQTKCLCKLHFWLTLHQ